MGWFSTQFARNWRNINYGAVVLLSVLMMFWPAEVNNLAGRVIFNGFYYPFYKLRLLVEDVAIRAEDCDQLRATVQRMSLQIELYEEALRENERLRQALRFEPPSGYRLMPAEVVSVDGYELPVRVIIDRGGTDSVYVNQPVINQQGLIGRVVTFTPDHSTVQLLTDPANRVAARVQDSREMGIVRYVTGRGMILDNFPVHGTIAVGDTIVSSGLGGVYPPGLFVGIVATVEREEHEPFCRVGLSPFANFHSIEELFLLSSADLR